MKFLLALLCLALPLAAQVVGPMVTPGNSGGGGSGTATNLSGQALVQVTNIAASLASSPTSGVSLANFNLTQFETNSAGVHVRSGALLTNLILRTGASNTTQLTIGAFIGQTNHALIVQNTNSGAQNALVVYPNTSRVGIGTNVPGASLDVQGSGILSGNLSIVGNVTGAVATVTTANITGTSTAATLRATSSQITGLATAAQFRATGANVVNATNGAVYLTSALGGYVLASDANGQVVETVIQSEVLENYGVHRTNFNVVNVTNDVRAQSFTGAGTGAGSLTLQGTNGNNAMLRAANSNSLPVTNILGVIHRAAASVVTLDANHSHQWAITNRIGAVTSVVLTNAAPGQDIEFTILGEASGGASRVVTVIPELGHLVGNLDTFGSALATSFSFTLTNGNAAEVYARVRKLNGTNVTTVVTRQFAF